MDNKPKRLTKPIIITSIDDNIYNVSEKDNKEIFHKLNDILMNNITENKSIFVLNFNSIIYNTIKDNKNFTVELYNNRDIIYDNKFVYDEIYVGLPCNEEQIIPVIDSIRFRNLILLDFDNNEVKVIESKVHCNIEFDDINNKTIRKATFSVDKIKNNEIYKISDKIYNDTVDLKDDILTINFFISRYESTDIDMKINYSINIDNNVHLAYMINKIYDEVYVALPFNYSLSSISDNINYRKLIIIDTCENKVRIRKSDKF